MTPRPRKDPSQDPRYVSTPHEGIKKHTASRIYYLRDTIYQEKDGALIPVPVDRSLKTRSITEALARANRIKASIAGGILQAKRKKQSERGTFAEAFDLLEKMQSTKAKKTLISAQTQLKHLRPFFCGRAADPEKGIEEIKPPCQYIDEFESKFESIWTDFKLHVERETPGRKLKHDRQHLVQALKRAHNAGWIKRVFTRKDFEISSVTEPVGQYIEDTEVNTILAGLLKYAQQREQREQERIARACARGEIPSEPAYWFPKKDYLQVLIALTMGMRKSEILRLSKEEVDLRKREVDLDPKRLKTRKRREVPVPITDDVFPLLKEAYELAPGPYLFPAIDQNRLGHPVDPDKPQEDNKYYWTKVREDTGIDVRFHDLRHTAITNLLEGGMPDFEVRKICGVSEVTMRRIYAHINRKSKDRFRQALAGRFTGGPKPQGDAAQIPLVKSQGSDI